MNILEIKNITKLFGSKKILHDISMVMKSGEVIAIFGPNGAGKTTSFNIIAGLIFPTSGSIELNKQDITNLPIYLRVKYGISYLPQDTSIFQNLTVWDNLIIALEATEELKQNYSDIIINLLSDFSLTHLKNEKALVLSGGERRRLEISRALIAKPKFLMLDEPIAGIDPISIKDMKDIILKLKKNDISIIITDHNIRDIIDIIDRAYIIYNGRVFMHGTADEIRNNTEVKNIYLGDIFN